MRYKHEENVEQLDTLCENKEAMLLMLSPTPTIVQCNYYLISLGLDSSKVSKPVRI